MKKVLLKTITLMTALMLIVFSLGVYGETMLSSKSVIFAEAYSGQNGTTLTAEVTASYVWEKTYDWTIAKTVTPATWNLFQGDTGTSRYTVSVTKTDGDESKYIEGTVSVTNGGGVATEGLAINIDLTIPGKDGDTILTTVPVNVSNNPVLDSGETGSYSYKITYTGIPDTTYKVTANVTITNHSGSLGTPKGPSPSATTVMPSEPNKVTNASINVDDTNGQSWSFSDSGSVNYDKTFSCADEGDNDNTATIRETGQSASASVTVNCYSLTVSKTANTSLIRTYNWTIDKEGDQTELILTKGQTYNVNYTVEVDVASVVDSNWAAAGTITVNNPAPMAAVINSVADIVSPAINATVTGAAFPYTLAPNGTLSLNYTVSLPDASSRTNTATAVLQNYDYHYSNDPEESGTTDFTGTASIDFTNAALTLVDESITVTDSIKGPLGTANYDEVPKTFTYTLTVGPYDTCGDYNYPNTASFTTNDTGDTGSDDWDVIIHVPCDGATLTIGYWKNHAGFGPQDDMVTGLLPILLGNADGSKSIEVDSAKKAVDILTMKTYGTASNGITKLYAQLLAAKLNIANGADDSAVADTIKAADSFLAGKDYNGWDKLSKSDQKLVLGWMSTLDMYNNGIIGPGHASE